MSGATDTKSKADRERERGNLVMTIVLLVVIGGPIVVLAVFLGRPGGTELGQMRVTEQSSEVQLAPEAGTRLDLVASVEAHVDDASVRSWSIERNGAGNVTWLVEMLRGDEVLETRQCDPFDGYLYSQSRSTLAGGEIDLELVLKMDHCALTAPGGPVTVRVRQVSTPADGRLEITRGELSIRS